MVSAELTQADALLIVDMQRDFCPGGALPVQLDSQVIETLNQWIDAAEHSGSLIVFSRDWHPPDHSSFESRDGDWPEHCVQGSEGAQFHSDLSLPSGTVIISKGEHPNAEQYSAFATGELQQILKEHGISRLWVGGVALDVCVQATVLDALKSGYEVHLITAATAPVNEEAGRCTLAEMKSAGVILE